MIHHEGRFVFFSIDSRERISNFTIIKKSNNYKQPKIYRVAFNYYHFDNIKMHIGSNELVGRLNSWWDNLCIANGYNPKEKNISMIGYCIIELGKNALENASGGEISVHFEHDHIKVILRDRGLGFEGNPFELIQSNRHHGLYEIQHFVDEFMIETNRRRFVLTSNYNKFKKMGNSSNIRHGTQITFMKFI
ncbi:MAG: hypothetical protein HY960_14150 [Ignavibacteriae bacterium]|nr:hypothetical protein [Ignavibacteriota bacterium]